MEHCSHGGRSWNAFLVAILLLLSTVSEGLRLTPNDAVAWINGQVGLKEDKNDHQMKSEDERWHGNGGSTYPDCSHACGPCMPCKRVMVSFKCSEEAESCPIVYKCMCRGRYYHVPSS